MSRSRLLSLIGTGTALGVVGLAFACASSGTYEARPVIAAALDSIPTLAADPVPTHGWTRKRLARGCGPNCKVDVWIGAYANSQTPDTLNPPATPLKIARVINMGRYRTAMYGLNRETQYDLVFQRRADGRGEYVFEPLRRRPEGHEQAREGVTMCPRHRAAPSPDADFRACGALPPRVVSKASMVGAPLSALFRILDLVSIGRGEDPAWWACGSGCCTALPVYPT